MYLHELYQRERHADFVRQAEHDRIANAIQTSSRKPLHRVALSAIGARLVDLGTKLQDNVETVTPPAPMFRVTKRA